VRRQSEHLGDYRAALDRLVGLGLAYPCFCTRADIAAAASAPHAGEALYPGTCRRLGDAERAARMATTRHAWRLDVEKSCQTTGPLDWIDADGGRVAAAPQRLGDAVIARKDAGASYHLAVVVDDALQGVTDVVRGEDLFEATHLHRLLQALLGLVAPRYHHHPLLLGDDGKRLAKRDRAQTLAAIRASGTTAEEVRRRLGFA
jgi:glutamyl-Q tRNA(Asp) synthetase